MSKKTQEEYVKELQSRNPDIEVVDRYINARTSIMHYCKKHNIYWKAIPSNILKGKGCKKCYIEKIKNKNTKTHFQYQKELAEKNQNIEVLEKYIKNDIPILHLCKKHNIKWKAMPSNILKGCGCYKCLTEKIKEKKSKSYNQYVLELEKVNPYIEVKETYSGMKTPILHYCKIHDEYWETAPCNVIKSSGCPKCIVDTRRKIKLLSNEEYINRLSIINPDIEVIESYIDSKTPILHYCKRHDEYWKTTPSTVLLGCGCYKCKNEKLRIANSLTNEQYIYELKRKNATVVPLEKYINSRTPILHKCLIHNVEWATPPTVVINGSGCPKCRSEKIRNKILKSHEKYELELININPNIIPLEKYVDSNTKILHKCLLDDNEWYANPSNILQGFGCPQCNESKGERQIRNWLENHNINYEAQKKFSDCVDIRLLPFDFYLTDYNKCIEYDGRQHYEPIEFFGGENTFKIRKKHDTIKTEYCINNGIHLLRIPYFSKDIEEKLNNFLFN
jgi:formate dehydrogenase assembly factor FdhD